MHFARPGLLSACFSWGLILKLAAEIHPLEQPAVWGDKEGRLGSSNALRPTEHHRSFRDGRTKLKHSALVESEARCPIGL